MSAGLMGLKVGDTVYFVDGFFMHHQARPGFRQWVHTSPSRGSRGEVIFVDPDRGFVTVKIGDKEWTGSPRMFAKVPPVELLAEVEEEEE